MEIDRKSKFGNRNITTPYIYSMVLVVAVCCLGHVKNTIDGFID